MATNIKDYVEEQRTYAGKVDAAFEAFAADNSAMGRLVKQIQNVSNDLSVEARATLVALEARVAAQGAQLIAFSAVPTPVPPAIASTA